MTDGKGLTPKNVGWITCGVEKLAYYFPTAQEPDFVPTEPPFTPDDQLAVNALRDHGIQVKPVLWGTDPQLLTHFDCLIMRSPWDYMDSTQQRQQFWQWLRALEEANLPVENPVSVMQWLSHKSYLLDLAALGIPVVPTHMVYRGHPMPDHLGLEDYPQGVVWKPCISGSAQGLVLITDQAMGEDADHRLEQEVAQNDYLYQPFIPEIQTHGEWSLIYLDGHYSHSVHKTTAEDSILVHGEYGGRLRFDDPPEEIRQASDSLMEELSHAFARHQHGEDVSHHSPPFPLLYLRLDWMVTGSGPLLSELEGVEPELFFRGCGQSVHRWVQCVERRLATSHPQQGEGLSPLNGT